MAHSSLAIANEFIQRGVEETPARYLTQMQLQKLVYLAHGWNLAVNDQPLVSDTFEAWAYGPVVRRLFDALNHYRRKEITKLIKWGEDTPFEVDDDGDAIVELNKEEKDVLDEVWQVYGKYPAFKLSALTHEPESPWKAAYETAQNQPLKNQDIQAYFRNLANAA